MKFAEDLNRRRAAHQLRQSISRGGTATPIAFGTELDFPQDGSENQNAAPRHARYFLARDRDRQVAAAREGSEPPAPHEDVNSPTGAVPASNKNMSMVLAVGDEILPSPQDSTSGNTQSRLQHGASAVLHRLTAIATVRMQFVIGASALMHASLLSYDLLILHYLCTPFIDNPCVYLCIGRCLLVLLHAVAKSGAFEAFLRQWVFHPRIHVIFDFRQAWMIFLVYADRVRDIGKYLAAEDPGRIETEKVFVRFSDMNGQTVADGQSDADLLSTADGRKAEFYRLATNVLNDLSLRADLESALEKVDSPFLHVDLSMPQIEGWRVGRRYRVIFRREVMEQSSKTGGGLVGPKTMEIRVYSSGRAMITVD
ncbi:unnamed protein product, partial [Amoebophrya sp. A120]|eukprot:GSA120T00020570001.1